MNYTIIIPLFNEELNVIKLHDELLKALDNDYFKNKKFEIIYVDDGSKDKTFEKINSITQTVIPVVKARHRKNVAQSVAIQTGSNLSKYENLIFMDGDLQNDPKDIITLVKVFEEGSDLTMGWRKSRQDPFFSKTLPSLIANFLVRVFTNSKIHDHGCALKVLKKKVFFNVTEFGADFHRLFAARAADLGYKITEVEISHRKRIYGKSNYGFSRVIKVLMDIIYLGFLKNKSKSLYYFGILGFSSFILSFLTFVTMLYFKFIANLSFILTPLPTLVVFLLMAGLNFILIGVVVQVFINSTNKNTKQDEVEIIEKIVDDRK